MQWEELFLQVRGQAAFSELDTGTQLQVVQLEQLFVPQHQLCPSSQLPLGGLARGLFTLACWGCPITHALGWGAHAPGPQASSIHMLLLQSLLF